MKVVMDDGDEVEHGPGFAYMTPGHDAWMVGASRVWWTIGRAPPTSPSA